MITNLQNFILLKKFFYLLKNKNLFFLLIPLVLFSSLLDLFGLATIGVLINYIINPLDNYNILLSSIIYLNFDLDDANIIFYIGLILILIFFLKNLLSIVINAFIINYSLINVENLRIKLMKSFQSLSYLNFVKKDSSEYLASIDNYVGTFGGIIKSLLRLSSDFVITIIIIFFLLSVNWLIVLTIIIILSILFFLYNSLILVKLNKYGKSTNDANEEMFQGIKEGILGFKELRILGMENNFLNIIKINAKQITKNALKYQIISSSPRYILEFFLILFVVIGLLIYSFFYDKEILQVVPTLSIFIFSALRLTPMINQSISNFSTLRFGSDAIFRIYEIIKNFNIEDENNFLKENLNINEKNKFKNLSLKNISFGYLTNQLIIKNLSIDIEKGSLIGIMGPSGSGKTTLIDLILGLIEPSNGDIYYNNNNLKINLSLWRSQIAYLPQDTFMINDTILKNITLGISDIDIDLNKVKRVLLEARLSHLIDELPEGIYSKIGERGMRLSGGQKQRLSLARAFYFDRDILIMDESTSSLDVQTENEIINSIASYKSKKTIIIITHRRESLKFCDKVYEIESGSISKIY